MTVGPWWLVMEAIASASLDRDPEGGTRSIEGEPSVPVSGECDD